MMSGTVLYALVDGTTDVPTPADWKYRGTGQLGPLVRQKADMEGF
jgi:hypothetical protein